MGGSMRNIVAKLLLGIVLSYVALCAAASDRALADVACPSQGNTPAGFATTLVFGGTGLSDGAFGHFPPHAWCLANGLNNDPATNDDFSVLENDVNVDVYTTTSESISASFPVTVSILPGSDGGCVAGVNRVDTPLTQNTEVICNFQFQFTSTPYNQTITITGTAHGALPADTSIMFR